MMIFCAIGKGRAGEQQQHLLTIPINHIFLRARQSIKKGIKIASLALFCRRVQQNMVHLKEMASKSSFQMLHAATVEGL